MLRSIFFIFLLFMFSTTEIRACLCGRGSPKQIIGGLRKSADFIFSGRAETVQVTRTGNYASIRVSRQWKGKLALENVKVYSDGGCFVSFIADKEYLIYARIDENGHLTTNICMRSGLLEKSELDLQILGKPRYKQKAWSGIKVIYEVDPEVKRTCNRHTGLGVNDGVTGF
jgi:hypothetical protein